MFQLFRGNLSLSISAILLFGGAFVCMILGLIMARSGASLRPIYWFAGLFALIVFPQFVGGFYKALYMSQVEAPHVAAQEQRIAAGHVDTNPRSMNAKSLFGADVDPQLVSDVRTAYGDIFVDADSAQFAVLASGETVLIARFKSFSSAEGAWVNYLRVAGLQTGGEGDSQRGYAITRAVGDRLYAWPFGTMLGVWTGQDDVAIRARMTAGGFEIPSDAPLHQGVDKGHHEAEGGAPQNKALRMGLIAVALLAYLFIVAFYFFKGAAWAGSSPAQAGESPMEAQALMRRLESINKIDVPFQIERGARPNELFATWRYADAKWIDLQRARGMQRSLRVRMVLDEVTHTVRATDYAASYDWSAGQGGANLEWKTGLGIVFFQHEHQRVFGLQLDDQGRFKPELSYAYTFNLQEMKSPLIEAVTRSGWGWRPTVWQGPAWLHWLTA